MGVMVRFQLEKCTALGKLPKGLHVFDGHSVAGRIQADRPVEEMWKLAELLQPQGACEFTPYKKVGNKFLPTGPRQIFGLHQRDDLPPEFRPALAS